MKTRKMNGYLKITVWLVIGALVGGTLGLGSAYLIKNGFTDFTSALAMGVSRNVPVIMTVLAVTGLVISLAAYRRCEAVIQGESCPEDEEEQDLLDWKYDIWNTVGVTGSNVVLVLSMIVFAFISVVDKDNMSTGYLVGSVVPFIICALICTFYQVAMVKQFRRKDPTKQGDAADANFQKKWLASCDEAEREVIYQTSYRTFQFMKGFLLILFVAALLLQVLSGSSMSAVVFLGISFGGMMVSYGIYSLKIQKESLDK